MRKRKVLLVIDLLNDFILDKGKLSCGKSAQMIVPNIKKEIEKARKENIPVIYICDNHHPDDPEFKVYPPHCISGTYGAEVVKELKPTKKDFIVKKRRYSGFFMTDLGLTIRDLRAEELILTGVCTNICVLYTASDARMRNYEVTILKDCVASFDEESHKFALKEMEKTLGCKIK